MSKEDSSPITKRESVGCCALPSQLPISVGRRKTKPVSNGRHLNAEGWEEESWKMCQGSCVDTFVLSKSIRQFLIIAVILCHQCLLLSDVKKNEVRLSSGIGSFLLYQF